MNDLNQSRNLAVRLRAGCFLGVFLLPVLTAALGLMLAATGPAQTFTTLHSFTASSSNSSGAFTNNDGRFRLSGLILSGNTLYGTAEYGGGSDRGTVFKVNTDGTGFTTLHSFAAGRFDSSGNVTNSDGWGPDSGLILSKNTLYGTATSGGSYGGGTLFKVNTDGTGFTNLHTFTATPPFTNGSGIVSYTNSDGAYPNAGLILSGTTLYGTTDIGGRSGNGTVFKINVDGTAFTTLYSFTALVPYHTNQNGVYSTNSDGSNPQAGLTLSSNTLYGTATAGGSSGLGTVFKVNADGTGFTNLHSFYGFFDAAGNFHGNDPCVPASGVGLSGNTLYGTTAFGGSTSVARCSRSTPTALVLQFCIISMTAATAPNRMDWFYQGTLYMEQRLIPGGLMSPRARARCSLSTQMVPVLQPCIDSRQPLCSIF